MKTLSKTTFLVLTMVVLASCNQQKNDVKTEAEIKQQALEEQMTAANEALFVAWNSGDTSIVEANMVAEFTRKQNGEPDAKRRDDYIGLINTFRTAIPDITFTYELVTIVGNKTISKWTAKGTNTGMFGDQPPTGKSSVTHGLTIFTFNDEGKVVSEEAYFDQLSYLQQWGYTLVPPATE
ncbi:ester cyclase [Geojedonia litorea]|uniref:Ester cyclase n=1 Tax=Geojedonia litorea TaxID=1268269 RepID=A0ABV9N0J2_9FLAO